MASPLARAALSLKGFFLPERGALKPAPYSAIVAAALGMGMLLASLNALHRLDWSLYDRYVTLATQRPASAPGIVVVAIDEPSFQEIGLSWPWPRTMHASLIQALREAGARTIVFDVIFDNPSQMPEDDLALAQAAKSAGNVVFAADWQETADQTYSLSQWIDPLEEIAQSARGIGIARLVYDPDGKMRRTPLLFQGRPTLALAAALLQPGFRMPRDPEAARLISFNGISRRGVKTVSYYQVLDYKTMLPPGTFQDAIVLVGLSLSSTPIVKGSVEYFLTPYQDPLPGVEVHAAVIDSLLRDRFIREPFANYIEIAAFGIVLALLLTPLFYRVGVFVSFLITAGTGLFLAFAGYLMYSLFHVQVPVVPPLLSVVSVFMLSYFYRFLLGVTERRMILGAFKHYLAPAIVDRILEDPSQLRLGGAAYTVTILFTDLVGFSTISEKLSPNVLHDLLTSYFREMIDILLEENATLDKLIGDAIMVYFGCPVPDPGHPLQACRAAIRMQRRMEDLNRGWHQRDLPLLRMRIGINSGPVVAGNMGTERIFNYTVLGDSVNLASRLEGVNKEYGTSTIISEDTFREVSKGVISRELDRIRVKGKSQAVSIYELVSLPGDFAPSKYGLLSVYSEGLHEYRRRRWTEAIAAFQGALEIDAQDGPSITMISRSRYYLENPPPEEWDGVFMMLTK
jgi:adenylate cyclase